MKQLIFVLAAAVFLPAPVFGADSSYDENVKDLMEVEEQMRERQELNEQQKEAIKKLEVKVQCTYDMVKKYESCEESYDKQSNDYFSCIEQAKRDKELCMGESSEG
jgi:hypothetical protein